MSKIPFELGVTLVQLAAAVLQVLHGQCGHVLILSRGIVPVFFQENLVVKWAPFNGASRCGMGAGPVLITSEESGIMGSARFPSIAWEQAGIKGEAHGKTE